jgi:hypothetical protein
MAAGRSFAPFATTFIFCILIGPYKMATRRSFHPPAAELLQKCEIREVFQNQF